MGLPNVLNLVGSWVLSHLGFGSLAPSDGSRGLIGPKTFLACYIGLLLCTVSYLPKMECSWSEMDLFAMNCFTSAFTFCEAYLIVPIELLLICCPTLLVGGFHRLCRQPCSLFGQDFNSISLQP